MGHALFVLALLVPTLSVACDDGSTAPAQDDDPACQVPDVLGRVTAIADVVVLSFADGSETVSSTVVVRDGRVESIAPSAAAVVPEGAVVVPGCGRYLVPGLADMHVHLNRADLGAYLASGVTTVRNLWGFPDLLRMKDEIEAGQLDGPTIYPMSSGLDGTPAKWPETQFVLSADDAAPVIEQQTAQGYATLKLYQDLTPDAFDAVVAEASSRGLPFGGHVPHRVGLTRALDSGYRFIEHLSGYEVVLGGSGQRGAFAWTSVDEELIPSLVSQTLAAGTWNSPTLEIFAQIAGNDANVVSNRRTFVKALFEAGAPLLIGTDSGIGRTEPGIALHQEIGQFTQAGLTPLEALRIATVEAARFLGEEDEFGRVEVGLRADLLLVSDNPLVRLEVLGDPVMVMVRGQRHP